MSDRQTETCEMILLVDAVGDYGVGRDAAAAREDYEQSVGALNECDGFRLVRVLVSVPLPVVPTLTGTAPDQGDASLRHSAPPVGEPRPPAAREESIMTVTDRPDNPPANDATLRDFFAAAALEGCVEKQFSDELLRRVGSTEMAAAAMASAAYEVADACLVARTRGTDPMFAAIEERDRLKQVLLVAAGRLSAIANAEIDGVIPQARDLARLADELARAARKEGK